jgi:hypothetical protein
MAYGASSTRAAADGWTLPDRLRHSASLTLHRMAACGGDLTTKRPRSWAGHEPDISRGTEVAVGGPTVFSAPNDMDLNDEFPTFRPDRNENTSDLGN